MGAWTFVRDHLEAIIGDKSRIICAGRPEAASPAVGSATRRPRRTLWDRLTRRRLHTQDLAHGTGKDDYKETTWGVAVSANARPSGDEHRWEDCAGRWFEALMRASLDAPG